MDDTFECGSGGTDVCQWLSVELLVFHGNVHKHYKLHSVRGALYDTSVKSIVLGENICVFLCCILRVLGV
jgi:hypothetical protein